MLSYTVIGIGTLLNASSVGTKLASADRKTYRPVIVPGYQRLFNLRAEHYEASNMLATQAEELGAHNVQPIKNAYFNGLAFAVDDAELEKLDERERYYRREAVEYHDFYTRESLGQGFLYVSPLNRRWIINDPEKLMPRWLDIALASQGAYKYGAAFGEMYEATTYLADGATPAVPYYRSRMKFDEEAPRYVEKFKK